MCSSLIWAALLFITFCWRTKFKRGFVDLGKNRLLSCRMINGFRPSMGEIDLNGSDLMKDLQKK